MSSSKAAWRIPVGATSADWGGAGRDALQREICWRERRDGKFRFLPTCGLCDVGASESPPLSSTFRRAYASVWRQRTVLLS